MPPRYLLIFALIVIMVAACNPAPELVDTAQPTVAASLTLSATAVPHTPTSTPPAIAQITPANTPTPVTPSATPTITNTPGPFEHTIQAGEGLIGIVLQYGHFDLAVLDEVVALNNTMSNADQLPAPGTTILIPRPTPSPTPEGGEMTATYAAQNPGVVQAAESLTGVHVVESGQSMVGIAQQYNATMAMLARLNPQLEFYWRSCDFSIPSGGSDCNPLLNIGDEITVPLPTPTPSATPTPDGSETPTLTPTPGPVRLLWPPPGVTIAGGPLMLRWVNVRPLQSDELYQVTVTDTTSGVVFTGFTDADALTLPGELVPLDAEQHAMVWEITTVRVGNDNVAFRVGAIGEQRNFIWTAPAQ